MISQRKNQVLVILVIVLVITNLAMLYYLLQYQKEEKKTRSEKQVEWVSKELKLTDAQQKQYIDLRAKRDSIMQPMNQRLRAAKMKMIGFLAQPPGLVSDSVIAAAATAITTAQKDIEIAYYQHFRRMQAICQPEQLPRLDTLLVRMIDRGNNKASVNTK